MRAHPSFGMTTTFSHNVYQNIPSINMSREVQKVLTDKYSLSTWLNTLVKCRPLSIFCGSSLLSTANQGDNVCRCVCLCALCCLNRLTNDQGTTLKF